MCRARRIPAPLTPSTAPPAAAARARLGSALPALLIFLSSTAFLSSAFAGELPELVSVESPYLGGMDPAVREQLAAARAELDAEVRAAGEGKRRGLGRAFGEMGQLYLAYDLTSPAAACLENARRLDQAELRWPYLLAALHQNERRLAEAEAGYLAALELRPRDHPALVRLGNVYLAGEEPERAQPFFERALEVEAGSAAALAGLGKAAAALGEHEQAVGYFRRALDQQPEASALRYPLALALRELGRVEEARAELARRGEVDVHFADPVAQELLGMATGAGVHIVLGNRALRQGSLEAAVARFRQALEADPDSVAAHRALGSAMGRLGDLEAAVAHYSAALALDPRDAALHYNLGTLLTRRGEDEQAARHFQAALARVPEHANARFNLATALGRLGRFAEAAEHYRILWRQEPEDFSTRFYLAQALLRLERFAEAAEHLEALARQEPERVRVQLGLARALRGSGRGEEARVAYGRALELLAASPLPEEEGRELAVAAHAELADLLAARGEAEAARAEAETALALEPGRADLARRLAALAARSGDLAAAAERYAAAVALEPENVEGRFGQAMALLLAGREAEARARLEEALAALPGEPRLTHLLARLLAAGSEAAQRDGVRALELVDRLLARERRPEYAETLAMAFAELGRFEEAAAWQRRLSAAARRDGAGEVYLATLAECLAAYEQRRPCRAPWLAANGPGGTAPAAAGSKD